MIPSDMLAELDALVREGHFPDRATAVREVLRLGLDRMRGRGPPVPARPPPPPGVNEPGSDRPIDVDPKRDVNWVG